MPQFGVSVTDGTIAEWLKSEGDAIAADEPLLAVSTDKVDTEVISPVAGILLKVLAPVGTVVPVGDPVALIAVHGPNTATSGSLRTAPSAVARQTRQLVSPVVARMAAEHNLDLAALEGSGRNGRVTKRDVVRAIEPGAASPAPAPAADRAPVPQPGPIPVPAVAALQGETHEPLTPMRRAIAEHMRRSLDTAAHAMSAIEVDMSAVDETRKRVKSEYVSGYGVNPTYLAFVAQAAVAELVRHPWLNAELRDGEIVGKGHVNLGIAVELDEGKGLLVPVVRDAASLNLLGMARAIADIAAGARERRIGPDDLHGGTFTITNPGGFGVVDGAPIINQPQSAILGTYAVVRRPWVVKDDRGEEALGIRPIMNLTLTYDHRLIDGAYAGRFLRDLRLRLETPQ
jgi:2-oxoglutarate dehydrogenase E2 component (dihydrolipoamide succinyltransferase)